MTFRIIHKKLSYSYGTVYATRTNEDGELEFLMYYLDDWNWVKAKDYQPMPV